MMPWVAGTHSKTGWYGAVLAGLVCKVVRGQGSRLLWPVHTNLRGTKKNEHPAAASDELHITLKAILRSTAVLHSTAPAAVAWPGYWDVEKQQRESNKICTSLCHLRE